MSTPGGTRATTSRFERLRAATDRVPTKWFAALGTGAFLSVTAAFGGLATVEKPPIPVLSPGDAHVNEQLSITVERAVLIDELTDAGIYVDEGERVLALVVTVENVWSETLSTVDDATVGGSVRLDSDASRRADSVARFDDTTLSPWLQPGVPAQLVLTWAVPADEWADGDEVVVDLFDQTLYTGSFVAYGQYWDDPTLSATVSVAITDVGAGADAEASDG